jgi:MFS family permease/quinol monooxygenase YgiN
MTASKNTSAWSPLSNRLFCALWIASIVSNIGTWMQNVAASWQMTELTRSAALVALMQTAASFPVFVLALPSGALADVVDRRRLLIVSQAWMLLAAGALGVVSIFGGASAGLLLWLTLFLAIGSAIGLPAWQSALPEIVGREMLPAAIGLNGISINIARSAGPAIGGILVAGLGAGPVFLLNAASFLAVMAVLLRWRRVASPSAAPAERIWGAIRAGVRYVRHSPDMRALTARVLAFVIPTSAYWALLPVGAAQRWRLGSLGYGLLLAAFGSGAVAAAALLPGIRRKTSLDRLTSFAGAASCAALLVCAIFRSPWLLAVASVASGASWMALLSTLSILSQTLVPEWIRTRSVAVYVLGTQGGLALGSALWGVAADGFGLKVAFAAAAVLAALGAAVSRMRWFRLSRIDSEDLVPSVRWPSPAARPNMDDGPVLVTVEYSVEQGRENEFRTAMRDVRRIRRRDGAVRWELFRDLAEATCFVETFVVESWAEHLRQHGRMTVADRRILARADACHLGPSEPRVKHLLADRGEIAFARNQGAGVTI